MRYFRSTALLQLILKVTVSNVYLVEYQALICVRVGKFNDPCFFKSLIVNALGAALLVRIVNEGVCSVFFDLLFHLIRLSASQPSAAYMSSHRSTFK